MPRRLAVSAFAAAVLLPSLACADPLNPVSVFTRAPVINQVLMLILIGASIACLVVCGLKLAGRPHEGGGSAFTAGLRLGGPIIGVLGAAFAEFRSSIAMANVTAPITLHNLAGGFAEATMLLTLGLLAGALAVIANSVVEARIDRAVLQG